MPLAELVQGGGGGGGGGKQAKPPRAPQQQDICSLLVRVLLRVTEGQPLTLETVKAAWRELSFSHVFEVGAALRRACLPCSLLPGPPDCVPLLPLTAQLCELQS